MYPRLQRGPNWGAKSYKWRERAPFLYSLFSFSRHTLHSLSFPRKGLSLLATKSCASRAAVAITPTARATQGSNATRTSTILYYGKSKMFNVGLTPSGAVGTEIKNVDYLGGFPELRGKGNLLSSAGECGGECSQVTILYLLVDLKRLCRSEWAYGIYGNGMGGRGSCFFHVFIDFGPFRH